MKECLLKSITQTLKDQVSSPSRKNYRKALLKEDMKGISGNLEKAWRLWSRNWVFSLPFSAAVVIPVCRDARKRLFQEKTKVSGSILQDVLALPAENAKKGALKRSSRSIILS